MLNIHKTVEDYSTVQYLSLYHDDFLQIEDILRQELGNDLQITYTGKDRREYSISGLSEIAKGKKIESIHFRSKSPELSIHFRRSSGISFNLWSKDDHTYAVVLKLLALLQPYKSNLRLLLDKFAFIIGVTLIAGPALFISYYSATNKAHVPVLIGILALLLIALGLALGAVGFSVITRRSFFTMSERGATNLIIRNREKIIISIVSGTIVALVSFTLNRIFGK